MTAARGMAALERYLLYVTVASLPLQALTVIPGTGVTVTKAAGGLLVVTALPRRLAAGQRPGRPGGIDVAIALFAAACAAAAFWSSDPTASRGALLGLVQYAAVYYGVVLAAGEPEALRRVPALLVVGCALSGFGALSALALGVPAPTVDAPVVGTTIRRICYGLTDGNEQALFLLFGFGLLLQCRELRAGKRLPWAVLSGAGILAGLALTMSRTGWLCAAALVGVRALAGGRSWRALVGGAIVLAVTAGGVLAVRPDVGEAVRRRALQGVVTGDASIASRVAHYAKAAEQAAAGGFTGHGLMTAERVAGGYTTPLGESMHVTVHSVPYIVWLETGWLGLLAYLWLWANVIGLAWTAASREWRGASEEGPSEGVIGGCATAWASVAATYGVFSLVMPFLYRSSLAVLLGCAVAAWRSGAGCGGGSDRGRGLE